MSFKLEACLPLLATSPCNLSPNYGLYSLILDQFHAKTYMKMKQIDDVLGGEEVWSYAPKTEGVCSTYGLHDLAALQVLVKPSFFTPP